MSLDRHMNEERKEHSTWNNEVHKISVATLTSVNDVRPRVFGDNLQIPPKFRAKSIAPPASVYMYIVMEANGVDTKWNPYGSARYRKLQQPLSVPYSI